MNAPCKGCEFREIACHVTCPMYLMYKKNKEKEMKCNVMRKAKYGCSVND